MYLSRNRATLVITIDGPVAAGKTTLARRLADRCGFTLLDTGAIYRAVALRCQQLDVPWSDEEAAGAIAGELDLEFRMSGAVNQVMISGCDVTEAIRRPEISEGASVVSALPTVRSALLELQREYARSNDIVAEGRDTGTVVFPDADIKVFLTASPEERARRRHQENLERGTTSRDLKKVLDALLQRDARDSRRATAPLRQPDNALVIDSTTLSADETEELLIEHLVAILPEIAAKSRESSR